MLVLKLVCFTSLMGTLLSSTIAGSVFYGEQVVLPVDDYTIRILDQGLEPFESFNITVDFANPPDKSSCENALCYLNACDQVTANATGKAILFTAELCDLSAALENLHNAGAKAGLHLFGAERVQDPFDIRTRLVFNPSAIFADPKNRMVLQRIHGFDSPRVLLQATGCDLDSPEETVEIPDTRKGSSSGATVSVGTKPDQCKLAGNAIAPLTVTISYTPDAWQELYNSPLWIAYVSCLWLVSVWLIQHTIRALVILHERAKNAKVQAGSALSLQQTVIIVLLVIGIGRFVDSCSTVARAYGHLFVSDLYSQLLYQYNLMLGVVMMAQLILFWIEILRNSSKRLINISRRTQLVVIGGCILGIIQVTVLVVLYSLKVSEDYIFFYTIHWFILGLVALFESIGMLIFGRKILNKLKKGASVRNGGGANLKPMTNLVTGSAFTLLMAVVVTASLLFYPPAVRSPKLFPISQIIIFLLETLTFVLTLRAVSPIAKVEVSDARRRGMTQTKIGKTAINGGGGSSDDSEPSGAVRKLSIGLAKLRRNITGKGRSDSLNSPTTVDHVAGAELVESDQGPGMRRMTIPSL